jgi:hypothetical protein
MGILAMLKKSDTAKAFAVAEAQQATWQAAVATNHEAVLAAQQAYDEARAAFHQADEHLEDDAMVEALKTSADRAERALRRARNRLADAEAHEREARTAVDAARSADARARVARCAADNVAPAVEALLEADARLRKLVSSDWRALNEFLLPELALTMLRGYLQKLTRIDTPPVRAKAPAGVTVVRFVRSYPGSNTFPSIPAYAEGETAGLAPAVAAQLIEAGYARGCR